MTNPTNAGNYSITMHVQEAAQHLGSANDVSRNNQREVTDFHETFGHVYTLVIRLRELLLHIGDIIDDADAALYTTDCRIPAENALNSAELDISDAISALATTITALHHTWIAIGHLHLHGAPNGQV